MTLIQIIVLSLIQGLTEFLPVSSSAHLILGSKVFDWPDQGLVFDVAPVDPRRADTRDRAQGRA